MQKQRNICPEMGENWGSFYKGSVINKPLQVLDSWTERGKHSEQKAQQVQRPWGKRMRVVEGLAEAMSAVCWEMGGGIQ